ncbi:hypothetical protein ACQCT5_04595 [Sutcliffiella halmapala]
MITLENIGLDENEDKVIVDFTYDGDQMEFKGKLKMTQDEFVESRKYGDLFMLESIVRNELNAWLEIE